MHVPRPHKQNIAKANLGSLRLRHGLQITERDRRRGKRIVLAPLRQSPLVVIKQHPAPNNPLLAPRSNTINVAARLSIRPVDVVQRDTIVENLFLLVAKVAQAVPLRRRLRVEGPDVVVDDARRFLVQLLVESLATEEGQRALGVQRPVEADARAGADFFGGGGDDGVGQAVEGAELVVGAVEAPGVVVGAGFV